MTAAEAGLGAKRLYILAFDHRVVLRRQFAGPVTLTDGDIQEMKAIVTDAVISVVQDVRSSTGADVGLLIDEETGAKQIRRAREFGIKVSMPIERSGADVFTLDYGADYLDHITRFAVDHAKVLVFLNPEDQRGTYWDQIASVTAALLGAAGAGVPQMLELIVPPSDAQLASVGGDLRLFDEQVRPDLVCRVIDDFYAAGARPELWKLEGLESAADYELVIGTIRAHDRSSNGIVLGRGAERARVDRWLQLAAATDGFCGFAIGRSIWFEGLAGLRSGVLDRAGAVQAVADEFHRFVSVYEAGSEGHTAELRPTALRALPTSG